MSDHKDLMKMPVQRQPCKTCPFEGETPVKLSQQRHTELHQNLAEGGNQLCHSVNDQMVCRGGRNISLRIFCARGFIEEPTDEALSDAWREHEAGDRP